LIAREKPLGIRQQSEMLQIISAILREGARAGQIECEGRDSWSDDEEELGWKRDIDMME